MKSFKDYVSDAEYAYNNPVVGDLFDLELSPTEIIESEVIEITEDGIVIAGTDSVVSLLETYSRDHDSHYDHINKHSEEEAVEENDDQWAQLRKDAEAGVKASLDKASDDRISALKNPPKEKGFIAQVGDKIIGGVKGAAKGFSGGTNAVKEEETNEAKYQGREVPLGRPMKGDVKKSKVYVKNPKTGKVVKVNFGDKTMKIKKSNPKRRKSFRARHNCANPGPRTKARYWSCRAW
jgi:hypothetical protein